MPIAFYALTGTNVEDLGAASMRAVAFGLCLPTDEVPPGMLYGTGEVGPLAVLGISENGGTAPPLVPDVTSIYVPLAIVGAELASHTADTGEAEATLAASGFLLDASDCVGLCTINLALTAGAPAPFVDSIIHVEQNAITMGAVGIFYDEALDVIGLESADTVALIAVLREAFQLRSTQASASDATRQIANRMGLSAVPQAVLRLLVSEGIAFDDTSTVTLDRLLSVIDAMTVSGACASAADAVSMIVESLTFAAAAELVNRERIEDAIGIESAVEQLYTAFEQLVSDVFLVATEENQLRLMVVMSDAFGIDAGLSSQAQAIAALRSGVGMSMTMAVDSGVYAATVMNMGTKQSSEYQNYPFNSFARVGDRYYGMTTDGIRLLEGEDDAGEQINWRLRLARTNLGSLNQKRMRSAYLGYAADGDLRFKVIVLNPQTNDLEAHAYRLLSQPASSAREARIKIGQGLMSVYWGFELEAIDATAFELDLLALEPLVIDKIMKGQGG